MFHAYHIENEHHVGRQWELTDVEMYRGTLSEHAWPERADKRFNFVSKVDKLTIVQERTVHDLVVSRRSPAHILTFGLFGKTKEQSRFSNMGRPARVTVRLTTDCQRFREWAQYTVNLILDSTYSGVRPSTADYKANLIFKADNLILYGCFVTSPTPVFGKATYYELSCDHMEADFPH